MVEKTKKQPPLTTVLPGAKMQFKIQLIPCSPRNRQQGLSIATQALRIKAVVTVLKGVDIDVRSGEEVLEVPYKRCYLAVLFDTCKSKKVAKVPTARAPPFRTTTGYFLETTAVL